MRLHRFFLFAAAFLAYRLHHLPFPSLLLHRLSLILTPLQPLFSLCLSLEAFLSTPSQLKPFTHRFLRLLIITSPSVRQREVRWSEKKYSEKYALICHPFLVGNFQGIKWWIMDEMEEKEKHTQTCLCIPIKGLLRKRRAKKKMKTCHAFLNS